jgi:lipopolysaccharide exporter
MATSFIAMLEALSAFGFETALIQRRSATRAHFDTAWTFNVVIGLSIGTLMLALSSELANMPGTELVAPINRAVFPVYARLAHDLNALRAEYLSVMSIVGFLAIPAVAGVASTARLVVPVVLGPNWTDAQAVLTLLAFFGITQVIQSNAYAAYLALGRPDIPARVTALHVAVLLVTLITLTAWKGIMGAAAAYLVTASIMVPVTFAYLFPMLGLHVRAFTQVVWRPLLAAAVMFVVVREFVVSHAPQQASTPQLALALIVAIALGLVSYALSIAMLWVLAGRPDGAESIVRRRIAAFVGTLATRMRN